MVNTALYPENEWASVCQNTVIKLNIFNIVFSKFMAKLHSLAASHLGVPRSLPPETKVQLPKTHNNQVTALAAQNLSEFRRGGGGVSALVLDKCRFDIA